MRIQESVIERMDWITVLLYLALVFFGWFTIYAAVYDATDPISILSMKHEAGRQLVWIIGSILLIIAIMVIEFRFFETVTYIVYGVFILMLIAVLLFGTKISGARSWFDLGIYRLQPSEFAKIATAMALARYLQDTNSHFEKPKHYLWVAGIILLPILLILKQPDAGTALIFMSFIIMLYREGLNPIIPIAGISFVVLFILTLLVPELYLYIGILALGGATILLGTKSTRRIIIVVAGMIVLSGAIKSMDFALNNILLPHQKTRIEVLFNPGLDPRGAGWNVTDRKSVV